MKFYLIHHAHTDIGYTDRQEKIAWNHAKYMENVVDILDEAGPGGKWEGFRWNVESLWMLKCFLRYGREDYKERFRDYVRKGWICLSGSFLNGTDLTDDLVLRETLADCRAMLKEMGFAPQCAMTADINGYPWGYVSAMADSGVKYLLSAVHTHHGHYAAGKKQAPFFWEGPDGAKLLVWQTEHYHLGNEMNIHQLSGQYSYMLNDGLPNTGLSNEELTKTRLFAYAEQLKKDGYPYDFCPILVSGLTTDNSPAGPAIIEFVRRWNAEYGEELPLEMTTLDRFFAEVEEHAESIPTYRGDWTDWWADGTCSTPDAVSHYREAVRKFHICRQMDPECRIVPEKLMEEAREYLMLYAEHTWGFSSSVSEPAHPMVNLLDMRKTYYAARANEAVSLCVDKLTESLGETPMVIWKDYRLHAVSPNPVPVTAAALIDLEILFTHRHFRLFSEQTGEEVPFQITQVARGKEFNILVRLKPFEHASFRLEELAPEPPDSVGMTCTYGADGVKDFAGDRFRDPDWVLTPFEMITPFLHIRWKIGKGITSIYDRKHGRELITDPDETAFCPVYEFTPVKTDPCTERRNMGRNRKAPHTLRNYGRLIDVRLVDHGPVLSRVILTYALEGSLQTELILTAYRDAARLDADLRLNKESRIEPENLYLTFPFDSGDSVLYADKTGCVFRPRIDQIPGTCADYYELQNGFAWVGPEGSAAVALKDAPMISMGTLLPHDIRLSGDPEMKNTDKVYSWVMNNFWETNFKASLGGFHQFRYSLILTDSTDPEEIFAALKAVNTGVLAFPSFDVPFEEE